MNAVVQLSSTIGVASACDALGVARASFYRRRLLYGPPREEAIPIPAARPVPPRALSSVEREGVLTVVEFRTLSGLRTRRNPRLFAG